MTYLQLASLRRSWIVRLHKIQHTLLTHLPVTPRAPQQTASDSSCLVRQSGH